MHVLTVWVLMGLSAASVALLVTRDKLFEPVREWWETHWLARIDAELVRADAVLKVAKLGHGERDPRLVDQLRQEMLERADEEPGLPLWASRKRRKQERPWSARLGRIARLQSYLTFLSCRACFPYWVFLLATVVTVGWAWGFDWAVAVDFSATVPVPTSYMVFVVVVQMPLLLRWLYYLVDSAVDR